MFRKPAVIAIIATSLFASAASAHPKLLAATPAADTVVAAPTRVEMRFSERLMPKLSGATLAMTGMAGMTHAPMPVADAAAGVGADGNSLVVTTKKPLSAGTYRVDWHVVSTDTHRITGSYAFSVR